MYLLLFFFFFVSINIQAVEKNLLEPAEKSEMVHQFLNSFDQQKFSTIAVPVIQEIQKNDPKINVFSMSQFPCFIKGSLSSFINSSGPYSTIKNEKDAETMMQKDQEVLSKAQPIYPLSTEEMPTFDLFRLKRFNLKSVSELFSTQAPIKPLAFETQCIESSVDYKIEKICASSICKGPNIVPMSKMLKEFFESIEIQEKKYKNNSDLMFYVLNVLKQEISSSVIGKKQCFFFRYGCGFLNPSKTQQTIFCRDFYAEI